MTAPPRLDLHGLKCPLPVLRTRKAMRTMAGGTDLVVLSTDPLAGLDIPAMAAADGHGVVRRWHEGDVVFVHLRKGAA